MSDPAVNPRPGAPTPGQPAVSIIVVSYNTREMTLDCLRSVFAETRTPFELIVVDNASPDGSAEAIAAAFPDIRLIASRENLGFAPANNMAVREARADLVLLLNPDTVVLDGAIDRLIDAYLELRSSPEERFIDAYRRVGMAPFKAALYEAHA